MVPAGSGALMVALPLLAGDSPALALVMGIAGLVLILGLLFALGTRRPSATPGSGGCHAATAVLLQDAQGPPPASISTDHPAQLPDRSYATPK